MAKKKSYPYLSGFTTLLTSFGADDVYIGKLNDDFEKIAKHVHSLIEFDLGDILYGLFGGNVIHTKKTAGRYDVHEYTDVNKIFTIKLRIGPSIYTGYSKKSMTIYGIKSIISIESPFAASENITIYPNRVAPNNVQIYSGSLPTLDTLVDYYAKVSMRLHYIDTIKEKLNKQIKLIEYVRNMTANNINYTELP